MSRTMFRLRIVGAVLAAAGLGVALFAFAYGAPLADDGLDSAQAMYEAQGVALSYNEDGELIDRGTTATAQAIMALLRDDWQYPIDDASFDADDPIVNTRDELMFQYATIVYHVLHGEVQVTLTEAQVPITYRGVTYDQAGTYPIEVGAYYGQLDRTHPIEGQLRNAWSPLALSLTSFLVAGHANQAAGELAYMTSLGIGAVGLLFVVAGAGLIWVSLSKKARGAHAEASAASSAKKRPPRPAPTKMAPEPAEKESWWVYRRRQ